ncbi:Chitin-binding, type 1 [Niveomyces insectorum RCEF 264]|uniref:Chitin-binding, type 1 n=1 Tax=Niveomyces insectorum RCEF 264 TaxID=1081102 RepID=A0A167WBG5_9HYPO|nr:Chitin-binding, type 1 [Niveomyces insectorum RCEF 264]
MNMNMNMHFRSLLAAGLLLPRLASGSGTSTVTCGFSMPASTGDTCTSFAVEWGLTEAGFEALNPGVVCPNLVAGTSYCVIGTVTAPTTTTTTTTRPTTTTTTRPASPTSTLPTVVDCTLSTAASDGDTCRSFTEEWGTSLSQFEALNPGVTCPGALVGGRSYCIVGSVVTVSVRPSKTTSSAPSPSASDISGGAPSPTQPGLAANCANFYLVAASDSCSTIATRFRLAAAVFAAWNPAVGATCDHLLPGYYVCVGIASSSSSTSSAPPLSSSTVPAGPKQPGIAPNCDSYHLVVPGNHCSTLEIQYNITAADFAAWNPAVGADCANLVPGYDVCVGVRPISTDGKCGAASAVGATCIGSAFGSCCSVKGNCGGTPAFCGVPEGCQTTFGICTPVSQDGKCGAASAENAMCIGSAFGDCCSAKGNCGHSPAFCGVPEGCQAAFGTCTPVSTDGKCGAASTVNAMCLGSGFGDCCSVKGNCGSTQAFCGVPEGCQSTYGVCTPVSTDGKCGAASAVNAMCLGSAFGDCCSVKGNCGASPAFCGVPQGCQSAYGTCTPVSTDGKCAAASTTNAMCQGSAFGDCCSVKGNCGATPAFCGVPEGCQPIFGTCTS